MYYANGVVEELKNSSQLVIFGAGLVGYEVVNCLLTGPYQLSIDFIMVSHQENNPDQIMGIPVIDLASAKHLVQFDATILVATMEKHLESICNNLERNNYFHIIPLTFESDLWSLLQGNYYREMQLSSQKNYLTLEEEVQQVHSKKKQAEEKNKTEKKSIHIYTVKSHVDRKLTEDLSGYFWEIPIQAGAALTKEKLCEVRDNQGEHISYKNKQYCELTALYWIWKNDHADYAGLCHYRRHFELSEKIIENLDETDIDVILTIPILNFPSVKKVYQYDHVGRDWEVMMEAIQQLAPNYLDTAKKMQDGNFYYGYNMFIARKTILNEYCAWLFPILQYCEEHCKAKKDNYQGRYIGFLAERLMGIYFLHHEVSYKIVHGRKHFVKR